MSWSCGIVGLPNAGKSTLFKALSMRDVVVESYPFSTIEPNLAVVPLMDHRLYLLAEKCCSVKVTPPGIEVVDVAGLVKGASRGEGLGNRFLGQLRSMDLLVHVVSAFRQGENTGGSVDPAENAATVNLELVLADLETLEGRKDRIAAKLKGGGKEALAEADFLERLAGHLNQGKPARLFPLRSAESRILEQLFLLTAKKMIYVANQAEGAPPEAVPPALARMAREEESPVVGLCARLEAELAELPDEEQKHFLAEYGLPEPGVWRLLTECCHLLNLITFYTVKGTEARAWVVPAGTGVADAAGKVHTDMARGFINAEVIPWDRFIDAGSVATAREMGYARTEGRDYPVSDGDILFVRFRS